MCLAGWARAQEEGVGVGTVEEVTVDADLGASREGSRTGQYTHLFLLETNRLTFLFMIVTVDLKPVQKNIIHLFKIIYHTYFVLIYNFVLTMDPIVTEQYVKKLYIQPQQLPTYSIFIAIEMENIPAIHDRVA